MAYTATPPKRRLSADHLPRLRLCRPFRIEIFGKTGKLSPIRGTDTIRKAALSLLFPAVPACCWHAGLGGADLSSQPLSGAAVHWQQRLPACSRWAAVVSRSARTHCGGNACRVGWNGINFSQGAATDPGRGQGACRDWPLSAAGQGGGAAVPA